MRVHRHVLYQIKDDNEANQLTYFGDLLTYFLWPDDPINDLTSAAMQVVYQIEGDNEASPLTKFGDLLTKIFGSKPWF